MDPRLEEHLRKKYNQGGLDAERESVNQGQFANNLMAAGSVLNKGDTSFYQGLNQQSDSRVKDYLLGLQNQEGQEFKAQESQAARNFQAENNVNNQKFQREQQTQAQRHSASENQKNRDNQNTIANTKATQAAQVAASKPKPGVIEMDKKYATVLNDFTSTGKGKVESGIQNLKDIRDQLLAEGDGMFSAGGGRTGDILPDVARSRKSVDWRDSAQNVSNQTLKDLFGGIISDSERTAAAKAFYNDSLPNSRNAAILDQKIKELEDSLANQLDKARYWEANGGTLGGYEANLGTSSDSASSSGPPGIGEVRRQLSNESIMRGDKPAQPTQPAGETRMHQGYEYRKTEGGWERIK